MKVLLSIKPEFAEKILNGTKRFEFRKGIFKNFAFGLLFGISVFAAAYGAEILIAVSQGNFH